MSDAIKVTPSQLKVLLIACIKAGRNVLITGAPGIGKSEIVEQACREAQADIILEHPAVDDPTDFKGLPFDAGDHADFKPFGNFNRAIKAKKRTVWFFDDLGQANNSVQAASMQLFLAKQVNGLKLPNHIMFIAATNRRTDKAGVTGILEPLKSRFTTIVELVTNVIDFSAHAVTIPDFSPMIIAFLRSNPQYLCQFSATADLTNSPLPRTWFNVNAIEHLGLPEEIESIAFAGAIGEAVANLYVVFRKMFKRIVNVDAILADPAGATIPEKLDERYAVSAALATRANEQNFGRIVTYATRMFKEADAGEFAVLIVRDAQRKEPKIIQTVAYVQMAAGPLGALIDGSK